MRKSRRQITVDGRIWFWQVGTCSVSARAQDTKEHRVVDFSTLTGMTWSSIEKGIWKRYFHIKPKQVADWLSGKLQNTQTPSEV